MRSEDHTKTKLVVRKAEVARLLGVSSWTLNRWVKTNQFPRSIYLTPGSPAVWRVCDVEAFLEKRRVARRAKPAKRGQLKQAAGEFDESDRSANQVPTGAPVEGTSDHER